MYIKFFIYIKLAYNTWISTINPCMLWFINGLVYTCVI